MEAPPAGAYLDWAATTPLLPEVFAAMVPFLSGEFANPSAVYAPARAARRAVDDARDAVAAFAGCAADEVVFTSGGTESDNLAVRGAYDARPGTIVVSAVEHDAVLGPATAVGGTVIAVDDAGAIDLDRLASALDASTVLVSVIAVQSETGIISDLEAVAAIVRRLAPQALFHTDAVQAAPFLPLAPLSALADLVSISAHKIGGPKGVGALVVRHHARDRIVPVARGGGQERELRAGTENVAGIAGFAAATAAVPVDLAEVTRLRDALAERITASCPEIAVTGAQVARSPGICHLHTPGVTAEELLILLDDAGVAASAGSACASGALEPSHVLSAMGWRDDEAREAIRFSLGRSTTEVEIATAAEATIAAIGRLRGGEVSERGKN